MSFSLSQEVRTGDQQNTPSGPGASGSASAGLPDRVRSGTSALPPGRAAATVSLVTALPLGTAISLGLRALVREAWLAAVGLAVALARQVLGLPAALVAGLLLTRGAVEALRSSPLDPAAPVAGLFFVLGQPSFLCLVAGLWLAGRLVGAAVRLAWLAGALPTLADALRPVPDGAPRFADGVASNLPRLVAVALLGLAVELGAAGFATALVLAGLQISGVAARDGAAWLAGPVALALTLAVAVPIALSLVSDLALVRAAVRWEGPVEAFAAATRRFLRRPAVYLLAALVFGAIGVVVALAVQAAGGVATGFAVSAPALVQAGPRLMLAALVAALAAAAELWWLASLTALATHEE